MLYDSLPSILEDAVLAAKGLEKQTLSMYFQLFWAIVLRPSRCSLHILFYDIVTYNLNVPQDLRNTIIRRCILGMTPLCLLLIIFFSFPLSLADHQKLEREARICRLLKHPNIGEEDVPFACLAFINTNVD